MTIMDRIADMVATALILPAALGFGMLALLLKIIPPLADNLVLAVVVLGMIFFGLGLTTGIMV